MKLALVTLGLGLAQLLGLAAAACPSVAIKTRGRVVVGKNTTLTVKVSNAWNKGQTPVTDGILTVGLCKDRLCLAAFCLRSCPHSRRAICQPSWTEHRRTPAIHIPCPPLYPSLQVTLPPGFAYAAGTKRSSPQPSVSGDTLTWSNLNFATGKRKQVFQVALSTNGCANGTHPQSVQASIASALQSCTKSAKPKTVSK